MDDTRHALMILAARTRGQMTARECEALLGPITREYGMYDEMDWNALATIDPRGPDCEQIDPRLVLGPDSGQLGTKPRNPTIRRLSRGVDYYKEKAEKKRLSGGTN